jgi:hypothetical protein
MLALAGAVQLYEVVLVKAATVYVRVPDEQAPAVTPLIVPTVPGTAAFVMASVLAALVPVQLEDTTLTLPETKADVN